MKPDKQDHLDQPALRLLSLGAGRQSTTIAILAAEGALGPLDGAIFADTGWEPDAVYRHLDRLEREVLAPAGIPLYRVSNGNIRDDVLNPNKNRSLPAYTASDPYEVTVVDAWRLCPDEQCGWRRLRELKVREQQEATGSDTLFALPASEFPADDGSVEAGLFDALLAVPKGAALTELEAVASADENAVQVATALRRAGLDAMPAPHELCNSAGRVAASSHQEMRRDLGMLKRSCTQQYKLRPILEQVRLLLGASVDKERACNYCNGTGERVAPWRAKRGEFVTAECSVCEGLGTISKVGQPPKGVWVEQWIGFSTDEIERVSNRGETRYAKLRYPLLELGMSVTQCEAFLKARGWGNVEKSACKTCPFHGNAHWRRVRDTRPEEWAEDIAFDEAYRNGPGMRQRRYLHVSCKPLAEAPIDRVRPIEWEKGSLVDQVYENDLAETGDPDGCSPWACRSGLPVSPGEVA